MTKEAQQRVIRLLRQLADQLESGEIVMVDDKNSNLATVRLDDAVASVGERTYELIYELRLTLKDGQQKGNEIE